MNLLACTHIRKALIIVFDKNDNKNFFEEKFAWLLGRWFANSTIRV